MNLLLLSLSAPPPESYNAVCPLPPFLFPVERPGPNITVGISLKTKKLKKPSSPPPLTTSLRLFLLWIPRQPVDLVEDFERVSKGALLLRGVTAAAPRKTHDTQKIKVKSRECAFTRTRYTHARTVQL